MKVTVPAREGRAVRVAKGQSIRITTPKGAQAAGFFACNAQSPAEWLSANHTWVTTFNVKQRESHQVDVIPQPVNFFTLTTVDADGTFRSPPNPVPPGAFVELEALMDLICVVSSCPFDLAVDGWTINAGGGPTELDVDVL